MSMTTLTAEGTSRSETVAGYQVTYHEAGSGPPLVMLHGGGPGASGWSNFGNNLPTYARHFRTILMNLPGFGGTGFPEKWKSHYITFAGDLLTGLLDQLGFERAHLLGNSVGAAVQARLALDHPGRVERMVMMGTGSALSVGLFAPRPSEGILRLHEFNDSSEKTPELMERFLRTLVYNQDLITPQLVQERFDAARVFEESDGNRALSTGYLQSEFPEQADLWTQMAKITADTLITWGKNDRVQPMDGAFLALSMMPNSRLYAIPKCGHWAQVDAKEEFERATISFLKDEVV